MGDVYKDSEWRSRPDMNRNIKNILNKPRERRTKEEVRILKTKGAVFGGCCERFADNTGCDCMEIAVGGTFTTRQNLTRTITIPKPKCPNCGGLGYFEDLKGRTPCDKCQPTSPKWNEDQKMEDSIKQHSGSKYVRTIRSCITREIIGEVDVYSVADAYGPMPMGRSHALKKVLCAGLRDKGTAIQDIKEAIDALKEDLKQLEADQ